ncbi:hypothetical protein ACDF64_09525 [Agromyces sp. MMS24-JH15]|uniref:hypothetical protein n=1 Tax=Agromyces sp. MMS24-JH15 TaxID=3243765 RepID=UPI003747D58A
MDDRDDRLLPATRALGAVIIPFLCVAAVLLLLMPGDTKATFAWQILPPLSAMLLGSAYVGGIWFFAWVVLETHWHRVWPGFPAVVVFAALLGVATMLHLDRFTYGHVSFIAWVVLYAVTPFAVAVVLVVNRRRDDGRPEQVDAVIPRPWAIALAAVGGAATVIGLVLFAMPSLLQVTWGWTLTPLTARVTGAVLTLPGLVNVWMLYDRRWSSFRWVVQAQIASVATMLVSIAVRAEDVRWERPSATGFVVMLAGAAIAYVVLSVRMERARRASRDVAGSPQRGSRAR